MSDHHISELIRDYGRSLLYRRHSAKIEKPREAPFAKGVCAARMGMEKDDNPYSPETEAYDDWEAGYESSVEAADAFALD